MYLFDTDIITNVLKKQPSRCLLERLTLIPKHQQHISTVTVSEIVYGAMKSSRPAYHLNNLEKILLPSVNVVSFDSKAACICGRLRAELEKKGQPLDLADLEIASIATAEDLILIAGNIRYFGRIKGLKLENWL